MLSHITRYRIVPVVVCSDAAQADALGEALVRGGLPIAEVTFRTAAAADTIRALARRDDLLVGAGTVVTTAQVDRAADAGARFIVSPGLDADVVRRAQERDLDVLPGCVTPSEIMAARKLGIDTVKFFPAGSYGGAKAIAALSAPFGDVQFIPTGGVSLANLADYLGQPCIPAVGGSWMVPAKAVDAGDTDTVAKLCAEAVAAAAQISK
ncbi:MAG TPA: bifunctional 4-hydroxy-2-oxoglutarate aldolase/2-dehydro-3-deoxy-phosphogluconate aldolase [Propionibacteriaceae bacterium]|nr:bifunctional 4-hydroxy-2-oxoglutarate aldolase/2-dehydro-3-deoxy-phosphogluconate aldolase [Propionibacteriaceae bacterium]